MRSSHSFLRDNAFLLAAILLPALVAAFFIIANTIPRYTVPDPAHDLVFRAARPYDGSPGTVSVDFIVRNGQVEAVVRLAPPQSYNPRWGLLLFDHETMRVRELPLDLPVLVPEGETRTVAIEALAGRRVMDEARAPDGYRVESERGSNSGLVGDIFGMGRYRSGLALSNGGRVVALELPPPYDEGYSQVSPVGWVVD